MTLTEKVVEVFRCAAGAVSCVHKKNEYAYGIIGCWLGEAASDSYGNKCPHQKKLKVVE